MKPCEGSHAPLGETASHRFPNFTDGGEISHPEANTTDRCRFKPLFHGETASSTHTASGKPVAEGEKLMEQTRQCGYRNGFEAGRQDACQMANHLLAPHVERFRQNLEYLTSYQHNIADHASTHIIKLAVEIAERIMGTDAYVTVADLQELRHPLIEAIGKRYELHLRYHRQDLSRLRQVMEHDGKTPLPMTSGISITDDVNVPRGAMFDGQDIEKKTSIEDRVRPFLQQLLKKVEQDQKA